MRSGVLFFCLGVLLAGAVPARADVNERAMEHLRRALELRREDRAEAAAAEYRQVLALEGVHATRREEAEERLRRLWQSSYEQARGLYGEKDWSGALEQLAAARELAPDDYALARTALLEAGSHYQSGDRARALGMYRAVVESEASLPTDLSMEALLALGDAESRADDHARARELFLEARALRDVFLAAHRERMKYPGFEIIMDSAAYFRYQETRDRFMRHWENALFRVARTWQAEDNASAALEIYLELADMGCADIYTRAVALRDAAALYQAAGMHREAVGALERAVRFRIAPHQRRPINRRLEEARELLGG